MTMTHKGRRGAAGSGAAAGYYSYTVDNSVRFNDDDSPALSWATGAAGTEETWTWSGWVKRSNISGTITLFSSWTDATNNARLIWSSTDFLNYYDQKTSTNINVVWSGKMRDPSAWYHVVLVMDTTEGTDTNRVKVFVNGGQITDTESATWPAEDYVGHYNADTTLYYGHRGDGAQDLDGYLADVVFIDGLALTPASFGEANDDGIWVPKDVSGLTFGTNGYWLDFEIAPGTGNGAGEDVSGNGNHFTEANLAANDQVADTPTNNWCTLNPIFHDLAGVYGDGKAASNGNLQCTSTRAGVDRGDICATMGMLANSTSSAIYYAEVTIDSTTAAVEVGITQDGRNARTGTIVGAGWQADGTGTGVGHWHANTSLATHTAGDVIGFIVDCENNVMWVTKNGTYQTGADSGAGSDAEVEAGDTSARNADLTSGVEYLFYQRQNSIGNSGLTWNFGQHAWNTEPPSNALPLNEANLATHRAWTITKGGDYFSVTLYTGNASADTDIDVGFDVTACMAAVKNRDQADEWKSVDTVRGVTKELNFDSTAAESTDANGVTAFGTTANSVRLGTGAGGYNDSGEAFAMHTWQEGATPGFDIVSYTGNGANRTISHSLGAAMDFGLFKNLTAATTDSWMVYHSGMASDPETDYKILEDTTAVADDATVWNDTAPTSSVFSLGTHVAVNTDTETYIAHLWAAIEGFSKFSYYIGNGNADGPFVYCGFRPALIILKNIDQANHWNFLDTARDVDNEVGLQLYPHITNAEAAHATILDILSNGFKLRTASGTQWNSVGDRFLFCAWAENPFPRTRAR